MSACQASAKTCTVTNRLCLIFDSTAKDWRRSSRYQLSMHCRHFAQERLQPDEGRIVVILLAPWKNQLVTHQLNHFSDVAGGYSMAQGHQAAGRANLGLPCTHGTGKN